MRILGLILIIIGGIILLPIKIENSTTINFIFDKFPKYLIKKATKFEDRIVKRQTGKRRRKKFAKKVSYIQEMITHDFYIPKYGTWIISFVLFCFGIYLL